MYMLYLQSALGVDMTLIMVIAPFSNPQRPELMYPLLKTRVSPPDFIVPPPLCT